MSTEQDGLTPEGIIYRERLKVLATSKQRAWVKDPKFGYAVVDSPDTNSFFLVFGNEVFNARKNEKDFDMWDGYLAARNIHPTGYDDDGGWVETTIRTPGEFQQTEADSQVFALEVKQVEPSMDRQALIQEIHAQMGEAIIESGCIFDITDHFSVEDSYNFLKLQKRDGFYTTVCLADGRPAVAVVIDAKQMFIDKITARRGARAVIETFISSFIDNAEGSSPVAIGFDRKNNFTAFQLPDILKQIYKKEEFDPENDTRGALVFWFPVREGINLPLHSADRVKDLVNKHMEPHTTDPTDDDFYDYGDEHLNELDEEQLLTLATEINEFNNLSDMRAHVLKRLHEFGVDTSHDEDEEDEAFEGGDIVEEFPDDGADAQV